MAAIRELWKRDGLADLSVETADLRLKVAKNTMGSDSATGGFFDGGKG